MFFHKKVPVNFQSPGRSGVSQFPDAELFLPDQFQDLFIFDDHHSLPV